MTDAITAYATNDVERNKLLALIGLDVTDFCRIREVERHGDILTVCTRENGELVEEIPFSLLAVQKAADKLINRINDEDDKTYAYYTFKIPDKNDTNKFHIKLLEQELQYKKEQLEKVEKILSNAGEKLEDTNGYWYNFYWKGIWVIAHDQKCRWTGLIHSKYATKELARREDGSSFKDLLEERLESDGEIVEFCVAHFEDIMVAVENFMEKKNDRQ